MNGVKSNFPLNRLLPFWRNDKRGRELRHEFCAAAGFVQRNFLLSFFAQESRKPTVRLKTSCSGFESDASRQKYPWRSNCTLVPGIAWASEGSTRQFVRT